VSLRRNSCARLLRFAALCCAFSSSIGAQASAAIEWREAISDEGIQVFKRARSGSSYEEVRAEARLAAKVDDFIPFFTEPAQYKKWVYGTLESGLVSQSQPFDFVFKGVFKIPWPFENRELVSRVQIERKPDRSALLARLSHSPSAAAVTPGCVRVSHFESLWAVNQADPNNVNLSIEMYVEPGGQLPPFIVNLVLSRIQLWSIKNLKREIEARSK
jgi:hypothetical protein